MILAMSTMMSVSINRLCIKSANEDMTDVKQILSDTKKVKSEILDIKQNCELEDREVS